MKMNNAIQDVQHDAGCVLLEGVYEQDCYTDEELDFDGDFDEPDFDPEAEIERLERMLENRIADLGKDPTEPIAGHGPTVFIGFDSEFVPGDEDKDNRILSLQFYLLGERGPLKHVVYPLGHTKAERPSFNGVIVELLMKALEEGAILEWPRMVVVCGFFLRIDLQAFGDLASFKNKLDNVGGRATSVKSSVEIELNDEDVARVLRNRTVLATDQDGIFRRLKVRFIDVGNHVAVGTSLAQVGDLLGLPKLELPDGYTKGRMDLFLEGDKDAFEEYGLRDAEIAVRFYQRLLDFSEAVTGKRSMPATASSLAVNMFMEQLRASGVDFDVAFGVQETSSTYWNAKKSSVVTVRTRSPIPMRSFIEPFAAACYSGGRNECYAFGPTDVGVYNDYDLAGAYTTGMVDLRHIDYENFRVSHDPADYVGHVLGFAYVRFTFPDGTRFPSLPVRNRDNGLVYPLSGFSYCTAPEIEVALNLGCDIEIKHGVVIPWRDGDDRLFEPYVLGIRELRARWVKGSLDELYAKLLGNGLYGKTAQGLKKKSVFDAQAMESVELPHSILTNAAIAAHTTGFIRAVLSEQIASIPPHRTVISATTDGFLTDADESELNLDGPMGRRFQALCERVAPGSKMLERKHKVRQLIAMKTRGQITAMPFDDEPIILAKAGVSPGIDADLHNDYMIDLFMCRKPGDKATTRPFTPFREQWVKDADVVRLKRKTTLNLEFDHKRRLLNPRMIAADGCEHVALNSVPWTDIHECERARAIFDGWRRKRCLKTLDDFEDWQDHYQFSLVRDRLQQSGMKGFGIRATDKGVVDVFRRLFLRAYTQGLCGLTKTMTYGELADWLTQNGYATTVDEVKNSKRSQFVGNAVPVTPRVMKLADVLEKGFPSIEINKFIESN
jgi:hypothetical protein